MSLFSDNNKGEVLLWNVHQVSQATGLSIHTIYSWISQHRIPYVKMGTRTMFKPDAIRAWIEEQQVKPINAR
jgi:excisionase family DNA binding protein